MAKLTDSTNWTGNFTITSGSGKTVTLDTDGKYVAKDIAITMVPQAATPAFTGGAISGTATATYTNASVSTTNDSGVSVQANGSANRAAVTYNGAVNGWVTANNGATAYGASTSATSLTPETKYITGVDIKTSKNFNITVPNGSSTITFNFAVDDNDNVLVT